MRRLNRFAASVAISGAASTRAVVHVPTTGRLAELLVPWASVYLAPVSSAHRKTAFDLLLVEQLGPGGLVCIDSRAANRVLSQYWRYSTGPWGGTVAGVRAEPAWGVGRADFLVEETGGPVLVEAKSVTLVRDGVGLFPDAPTLRGARHLDELAEWVSCGRGRAAAVFVVLRDDAHAVAPNRAADPRFAAAFDRARDAGVRTIAYRCSVTLESVGIEAEIPVI